MLRVRQSQTTLALALTGATLALAGCGSSSPIVPKGKHETALQIFNAAGCGGCHTLKAANSSGDAGPNLDSLKPSVAAVVTQVSNGGGIMPSFAKTLTRAQIQQVAEFVAAAAKSD